MSGGPADSEGQTEAGLGPDSGAATRKTFVEKVLGTHSSHPDVSRQRLAAWRWCGRGVTAIGAAFAAYTVYRAFQGSDSMLGGLLRAFRQIVPATDTLLMVVAFTLSATLTAALTIRMARLGAETRQASTRGLMAGTGTVILSCALAGLCLLFGWLVTTRSVDLIRENRWMIAVAAALPLEFILVYSEYKEGRERGGAWWVLAGIRQAFFAAAVAAMVILMTPGASTWAAESLTSILKTSGILSKLPTVGPMLDSLLNKVLVNKLGGFIASALSLITAITIVTWVSTKVSRIASDDPVERSKRRPGCLVRAISAPFRLLSLLNPLRWFTKQKGHEGNEESEVVATASGASTAGAPHWTNAVLKELKSIAKGDIRFGFDPASDGLGERNNRDYSPDSDESHLEILFASRAPTVDQLEALQLFDKLWGDHAQAVQKHGFGAAVESHADLLIQSFPESFDDPNDLGALELLIAASMIAVVSRGQRVLFLVDGDAQRDQVLRAIAARMQALRIETLYRASSLQNGEMATWAPPAGAPGTSMEERPPDIMVATPGEYERAFFGGANAQHIIRALMFDAEVVMVPNLLQLSLSPEGRLHLPFLLDKHRLALACENRSMQLVLSTPPVGERPIRGRDDDGAAPEVHVALESLALRFFGGDSRLQGHSAVLRRRGSAKPARLTISVPPSSVSACVYSVAMLVAQREGVRNVCLVLSREDPRPKPERLAKLVLGNDQITVVHELDAADPSDLAEKLKPFRVVLVEGRAGGRLVRQVCSRVAASTTLIVEVTGGKRAILAPTPKWSLVLPVFPAPESPALALSHLRSAVFQLPSDSLLRRDEFVRFGIGWNRSSWSSAEGYQVLHEGWSIQLDGEPNASLGTMSDQGTIWPAVILRAEVRKERPVLLHAPVERGLSLAGDRVLLLAEDGIPPDPERAAQWVTQRGQLLGQCDLAYANMMLFAGQRQAYRAISSEHAGATGWIITGHPAHGDPDEPIVPAISSLVTVPERAEGKVIQVKQADHVRICSIRDLGGEQRCLSEERIAGLVPRRHKEALADGVIDEAGVSRFGPIRFTMRVGMSLVSIGSANWMRGLEQPGCEAGQDPRLPDWVSGQWSVGRSLSNGREFSPAFTRAVQRSLSAVAPAILDFARVAAFRIAGADDGVVIAFIEPYTTVGTAADAMRMLLDDRALRQRFIGRMVESIVDVNSDELPNAPIYILELSEDRRKADHEWARTLIASIPGTIVDVGAPLGVIALDAEAPAATAHPFNPTPTGKQGGHHQWRWVHAEEDCDFSVEIDVSQSQADAATGSFGCSPQEADPDRMKAVGIRLLEGNRIAPDYDWIVSRSVEALTPLAERLLVLAQAAGASTARERIEFFASFVQSLKYRLDAEGRIKDGRLRLGVQMPLETLYTKQGDCDSLSILLVGLVRAARIAPSCVVLIDEVDGGHAMAAFELDSRAKSDWSITVPARGDCETRVYTLVETTSAGWLPGQVDPSYRGRYVSLAAIA